MTEKRFVGNFQGKMLVSIKDKKNNCNVNILQIVEIANKLSGENEQLKKENEKIQVKNKGLQSELEIWKKDINHSNNIINRLNDENERLEFMNGINRSALLDYEYDIKKLEEKNEQLKKELFESEKNYFMETYSDNPTRRDKKLQSLKEEFKERFGVDYE